MKSEKFNIDFMLDCVRKIEDSSKDVDFEVFKNNQEKQSAIILQIMLIGESAKKLSEETKNKINLPWKEIVGFRDIAVHDYISLDLNKIWNSVQNDIPELKKKLLEYK
jgi:uncharacterized protein with HEPN domain